jgi:hypothetical protein
MSGSNGQLAEIAVNLARLSVAVRALRGDVDALRQEVRNENAELRGDLARAMSQQNRAIDEAKKKRNWRLGAWPAFWTPPHPAGRGLTACRAGGCCMG